MEQTKNFSEVFSEPSNREREATLISLLNSCRPIHRDGGGNFIFEAKSIDKNMNVTFVKKYVKY